LAAALFWGRGALPGIWVGAFTGNVADYYFGSTGFSFAAHALVAVGIATGSTVQAFVGATLLSKWVGNHDLLESGSNVLRLFGAASTACLIASSVGVLSLAVAGFTPLSAIGFTWLTWWMGDAVGIVLVTPFLLVWFTKSNRSLRDWVEEILLMLVLLLVGYIAFADRFANDALAASVAYLTVPLIVISTFRFGKYGATSSLLLFAGLAVWGTAHGRGPLVFESTAESLLSLQAFAGILALTALALAGVLEERKTEANLKSAAITKMQDLLTEVSTLRSMIPVCAWCKKVRNDAGAWEQLEQYVQRSFAASFTHGICPDCRDSADDRDDSLDPGE
jgi:integral membrane sensor domain MASE1